MNYSLAKELKEAGFPQEIKDGSFYWTCTIVMRRFCWGGEGEDKPYGEYALDPTLEELIEACGEDINRITQWAKEWGAYSDTKRIGATGTTPTEAVARLWLALTKSK